MKKKVSMTKQAFVKEHKHLVKVLKKPTKAKLMREALDQQRELERKR